MGKKVVSLKPLNGVYFETKKKILIGVKIIEFHLSIHFG